jgi:hypothetical protein
MGKPYEHGVMTIPQMGIQSRQHGEHQQVSSGGYNRQYDMLGM